MTRRLRASTIFPVARACRPELMPWSVLRPEQKLPFAFFGNERSWWTSKHNGQSIARSFGPIDPTAGVDLCSPLFLLRWSSFEAEHVGHTFRNPVRKVFRF